MTTDPTRPLTSGDIAAMAADSREIGGEGTACVHDWVAASSGCLPVDEARNVRRCRNCVAVMWDMPMNHDAGSDEAAPAAAFRRLGERLTQQGQAVCAAYGMQPASETDQRLWVGTYETDDPMPRVGLRQTDLHWGTGIGTDATRTDHEVGIPVCDDDGRELGEMRMGYANARTLAAMLADAVTADPPIYRTRATRIPLDGLTDDKLDHLYDRLDLAEEFVAAFVMRGNPETWERQATEIARQAKQIGDLRTRLSALADDLTSPSHANIPPHMIAGAIWGALEEDTSDDTPEQP